MTDKFISTSGKTRQGGAPSLHKKDFLAHTDGGAWRHTANQIDVTSIPSVGGDNVQDVLGNIANIISNAGSGFISIGSSNDGYVAGDYNVGVSGYSTLKEAFAAAVTDDRLTAGGVILLMANRYKTSDTIEIPAGITVIGEITGTTIVGETSDVPIFRILKQDTVLDINGDSGTGPMLTMSGSDYYSTKFYNLMIFDNLDGYTNMGNNSLITSPMIEVQRGANFECERVSFFGRVASGVVLNRSKTPAAIGTTTGNTNGTTISVRNCFIDGVKNAINFATALGDVDTLDVSNCRIRFFGAEGATTSNSDCAIVSSLAKINIHNNFILGAGSKCWHIINLATSGGTTSNCKVSLIGNTGSGGFSTVAHLIINATGLTSIRTVLMGNSWGVNQSDLQPNDWYFIISSAATTSKLGDIFGSGALDTILTLLSTSSSSRNYVYIMPGTYNVTLNSGTVTNANLIGIPDISNSININLNLSGATTDSLGNKYISLGHECKNVTFSSSTTNQTVNFINDLATKIIVVDQIYFNNTTCNINLTSSLSSKGYLISNCRFTQSGLFTENVSLVLPKAGRAEIKNCYFNLSGYAISYGDTLYAADTSLTPLLISNCFFDGTGRTINAAAPGSANSYYLDINNESTNLVMENCTFSDGTLSTLTTLNRYLYINCRNVNINQCYFDIPSYSYSSPGTYSLSACYLNFIENISVTNNVFKSGSNNLKIVRPTSSITQNSILIDSNKFTNLASAATQTLLDIECDTSAFLSKNPSIDITNNIFNNISTAACNTVLHTEVTGSAYETGGIVQVYSRGSDVKFTNNTLIGTCYEPTSNPFTNYSGVYINTYNSDTGTTTKNNTTIFANNIINLFSAAYTPNAVGKSVTCAHIKSSLVKVQNNLLNYENAGSATSGFRGPLMLECTAINSWGDAIVSNNTFGRCNATGTLVSLNATKTGFIHIDNTNIRGLITNNTFLSETPDGSTQTIMYSTLSAASEWIVELNKNQTKVIQLRGGFNGISTINNKSIPAGLSSSIEENPTQGSGNYLRFVYADTSTTTTFDKYVYLGDIIPHGAYIVSISVSWNITATATGSINLTLDDTAFTTPVTTTANIASVTSGTLTVTPSANIFVSGSVSEPWFNINASINSGTTKTLNITNINISYRY